MPLTASDSPGAAAAAAANLAGITNGPNETPDTATPRSPHRRRKQHRMKQHEKGAIRGAGLWKDEEEEKDTASSDRDGRGMQAASLSGSPGNRAGQHKTTGSGPRTPVKLGHSRSSSGASIPGFSPTRTAQTDVRRRKNAAGLSTPSRTTANSSTDLSPIRSTQAASISDRSKTGIATAYRYFSMIIDGIAHLFRLVAALISVITAILSPLIVLLGPVLLPLVLVLIASGLIYYLAPYILSRISSFLLTLPYSSLSALFRFLPFSFPFGISTLSTVSNRLLSLDLDIDHSAAYAALTVPFRYIGASTLCTATGVFCDAAPAGVAPLWAWSLWRFGGGRGGNMLDVGRLARGLGKEVGQVRDIFDSVRSMGDRSMVDGLAYVKIWELATAVGVSSQLDDREIIGSELQELGDMTRDLSDKVREIDSTAVDSFNWIAWDFQTLLNTIAPSPDQSSPVSEGKAYELSIPLTASQERHLNATLSKRLDGLVDRLDTSLSALHRLTADTHDLAVRASTKGQTLHRELSRISSQLRNEAALDPMWRSTVDIVVQRLKGGPRSRSEIIKEDIRLTSQVIGEVEDLRWHLEHLRAAVKQYRDGVGLNKAQVLGFHAVAEDLGLEAVEEVRVLGRLVEGLTGAVERAKGSGRVGGGGGGKGRGALALGRGGP